VRATETKTRTSSSAEAGARSERVKRRGEELNALKLRVDVGGLGVVAEAEERRVGWAEERWAVLDVNEKGQGQTGELREIGYV
jgi:hypothetical protein